MNDLTKPGEAVAQRLVYLFPRKGHPYYVVTPVYTRASAGIKALHLLCHTLNRLGESAYLWFDPKPGRGVLATNPDLQTPVLNEAVMAEHHREGRTPIVVYPEVISGNPLRAPLVVRYVLNYPGLLGGDVRYPDSEITIAYSAKLAQAANVPPERILFVPTSDTRIFHPGDATQPRRGSCFYAGKFRDVHGGVPFDITKDSIEITRLKPDSQTPEQIAELFRRSEVFYAYENTALAIEAMLCGCPTVFLPNPHFKEVIAADELGWDGFAWGAEPKEVQRAKDTVGRAYLNYMRTYERYWEQLASFVAMTQQRAAKTPYPVPLHVGRSRWERLRKSVGALRKPRRLLQLTAYALLLFVVARYSRS